MKKNAVLFYFDTCNERYYENLKHLISKTNSFSEVKCCSDFNASFEDLENEEFKLDLPINWKTNFQPVMFSTWIKDAISEDDTLKITENLLISNQPDSTNGQASGVKGKKKAKPSKKFHILDVSTLISTKSDDPVTEPGLCPINDVDVSQIPNKQVGAPKLDNSSQITLPTTHTILPKKENTTITSNVDSASIKKITSNKEGQSSPSKKIENGKVSTRKVTKEKIGKSSEKSSKTNKINADSASKTSKGKCETKSSNINESVPTPQKLKPNRLLVPVQRTKKLVKTLPTEKIRLTGKFARMDLEKKYKDERHKIRAKEASFSKYASFDDDGY